MHFSASYFSGTSARKILKFSTIVGYDSLYCGKEKRPASAYSSIYLPIFFLFNQNFHKKGFSISIEL